MAIEQQWQARVGGSDVWHQLDVEYEGPVEMQREAWAVVAAEALVISLVEEYMWSDGDIITVEVVSPAGQEFTLDMALRQQWMADRVG